MKKLIYWITIYRVCIMIHELPGRLHKALDIALVEYKRIVRTVNEAKSENTAKKVEEQPRVGISSRSDMVMDRIGF